MRNQKNVMSVLTKTALTIAIFAIAGFAKSEEILKFPSEGFTSLFNGKDFTGWTNKGGFIEDNGDWKSHWEIKDNGFQSYFKNKNHFFLYTEKQDYKNFHLKFEFLMKEDKRTTLKNGDIINISTNGAIYTHQGYFAVGTGDGSWFPSHASKEAKAMIKKNGFTKKTNLYNVWNKAELIINDNKITMLINGKFLIKDFERAKDKRFLKGSGPIGFSKHSDKSYKVKIKGSDKKVTAFIYYGIAYKNIQIKEL